MGKLKNYVLGGVAVGAIALGASLLRDAPENYKIPESNSYASAKVETSPVKNTLEEKSVENVAPVIVVPAIPKSEPELREMPSCLEEILTRPEFNYDFKDSLSAQLERLLVMSPQWRKPEYVTEYSSSLKGNSGELRVEYSFKGMEIEETQSVKLTNEFSTDRGHASTKIRFIIRNKENRELSKILTYNLPFKDGDVSIDASMSFKKNEVVESNTLNIWSFEKPDSRNTYKVDKTVNPNLFGDGKERKGDEELEHNYQERVSGGLIEDVRNKISGTFQEFYNTLPKKD